ncbi:13524_t:CDS:1, partial [Dentiscutata heterogama]
PDFNAILAVIESLNPRHIHFSSYLAEFFTINSDELDYKNRSLEKMIKINT